MGRIVFSNTISKVKGTMEVGNQLCGSPGVDDTDPREALVVRVKETRCA